MSEIARINVADSVFECDVCSNTVGNVLQQTVGVEDVVTDEATRCLEVSYDPRQTNRTELESIVAEWGYAP